MFPRVHALQPCQHGQHEEQPFAAGIEKRQAACQPRRRRGVGRREGLGDVNVLVGFAPLKPAEFVFIKIQQMSGQIDF